MLTMIVYYHCKSGMRNQFVNELSAKNIAALCQAEPGNVQYNYFLSQKDADTVLLLEKWESEEAQKVHLSTRNFEVLGTIKAQFVESVDIERFVTQ